ALGHHLARQAALEVAYVFERARLNLLGLDERADKRFVLRFGEGTVYVRLVAERGRVVACAAGCTARFAPARLLEHLRPADRFRAHDRRERVVVREVRRADDRGDARCEGVGRERPGREDDGPLARDLADLTMLDANVGMELDRAGDLRGEPLAVD